MNIPPKPSVLLDSSPLITLCICKVDKQPIIHRLLNYTDIAVTDQVVREIVLRQEKSDVRIARPLLREGLIATESAPLTPLISDFYAISETDCGVIRLGLTFPQRLTVIDDKEEYIIACRYGLRPIFLLDFLVLLVRQHGLDKGAARDMVHSIAKRYSPSFIAHTLAMLE